MNKEYDLVVGVPTSGLNHVSDIPCTREDEACAIAAGAVLAGKTTKVFMQNSGFLLTLDIQMSLLLPYGIDIGDLSIFNKPEPEHHLYTATMLQPLLTLMRQVYDKVRSHLGDNVKNN